MNKKVKIIVALLITCLLLASVSYAYVVRKSTSSNIITFGKLKMKLIESTIEDGKEISIQDGSNIDITNNPTVNRYIRVRNVGKHPMYVRISLNSYLKVNNKKINANDLITYNVNEEDYIYKDGWYYYKYELKPGKETSNLITGISFDVDKVLNNYGKGLFDLDIDAGAVQSENNETDILKVKGWPNN